MGYAKKKNDNEGPHTNDFIIEKKASISALSIARYFNYSPDVILCDGKRKTSCIDDNTKQQQNRDTL